MKRISYYIIHCTPEENQNGVFHYSHVFSNESKALAEARKMREKVGNDYFVTVEKHHEVYDHFAWHVDYERGGVELVEYC